MHTGDISVGAVTANAIVGGNLPIAAGVALRCKMMKTDNVAVCFFGDGASNEGSFHEAMNAAAVWKPLWTVFQWEALPVTQEPASSAVLRNWTAMRRKK